MVDDHLTDEQQAEIVRSWLRDNGGYLLGGLALGLGALFGLNQWEKYQQGSAEQASALYDNIVGAILAERPTSANQYIVSLEESHRNSPYLDQARLMMAKSHMDRNEFEVAASYLAQIIADTGSSEIAHIARLRLARIRLHQQQYDEALNVLNAAEGNSAFQTRYHEVLGDVYVAMNQPNEAREQYRLALGDAAQNVAVDRVYVQAKLDALGSDTTASAEDSFAESAVASGDAAVAE